MPVHRDSGDHFHLPQNDLVSGGMDGTVRVWDATGIPLHQPLPGHQDEVSSVAVGRLGDTDVIVSGGMDRTVRVWDAAGSLNAVMDLVEPCSSLSLQAGGLAIATRSALAFLAHRTALGS